MKKHMHYGLFFTKGFITLIDELLLSYYSTIPKEDFLHFFYIIEKSKENNNMVELPRDIRNNFGKSYGKWKFKQIVDILESLDIIVSTTYSNYEGNNHCKAYGYKQEFQTKLIDKELEFLFCEISEKTYNIINKSYSIPEDPVLFHHYETISKLEIDIDKAEHFAKQYSNEKFLRIMRDIMAIHYKDRIIVTDDPRTGRIFTSFNMMKKELRELCSFNNSPLVSLDLKSSQPYLLASILLKENPDNKEVQEFYDLITQKDIYIWLAEQWGFSDIFSKEESRDMAKKMFFNYLYKGNQGSNSAQEIFKHNFPFVYELIKEKKRKEELWLVLQKLEASIFIPVANQFVLEGCLSVHDSLYFPERIRGRVEKALKDRLAQLFLINYNLS